MSIKRPTRGKEEPEGTALKRAQTYQCIVGIFLQPRPQGVLHYSKIKVLYEQTCELNRGWKRNNES